MLPIRVAFACCWFSLSLAAPLDSGMRSEMLEAHNRVRSSIGVAPLVWSDKLASVAQSWADLLAAEGRLHHRASPRYGENLYLIGGGRAAPNDVVSAWAAEQSDYDYRTNTCHATCGHYTQIVWRNTKTVGCAVARSRGIEVWVCEYSPPGNYVGQKPY